MADERARELRRSMTPREVKLWLHLRQLRAQGYHFRRQAPRGRYILDFVCLRHRSSSKSTDPSTASRLAPNRTRGATAFSIGGASAPSGSGTTRSTESSTASSTRSGMRSSKRDPAGVRRALRRRAAAPPPPRPKARGGPPPPGGGGGGPA